uniref:Uncharacterized protein n=1 Tax=Nelumbo nucifera TaxID=4432 RepID=A0A822XRH4_NELNU|nr:TPA_asm: hypothetical protein HUJ06_023029 [Nelumbo nucifera]
MGDVLNAGRCASGICCGTSWGADLNSLSQHQKAEKERRQVQRKKRVNSPIPSNEATRRGFSFCRYVPRIINIDGGVCRFCCDFSGYLVFHFADTYGGSLT